MNAAFMPYRAALAGRCRGSQETGGAGGTRRQNSTEIRACGFWLEAELGAVRPRLVVLLGAVAMSSGEARDDGLARADGFAPIESYWVIGDSKSIALFSRISAAAPEIHPCYGREPRRGRLSRPYAGSAQVHGAGFRA
jgi:hypothetical protein